MAVCRDGSTLVQSAQRGPYSTPHAVEYPKRTLMVAKHVDCATVVVLGWCAPHVGPTRKDTIGKRGHKLRRRVFGTACVVQVTHTHLHHQRCQHMKLLYGGPQPRQP